MKMELLGGPKDGDMWDGGPALTLYFESPQGMPPVATFVSDGLELPPLRKVHKYVLRIAPCWSPHYVYDGMVLK